MNARLFDEGMVEAQVWFQELMDNFMASWLGNRAPQEEQDGEYNEETEDLYSQEE